MLLDVEMVQALIAAASPEDLADMTAQLAALLEMARLRSHLERVRELLAMVPTREPKCLVSIRDAAALLGVCEDTARELIQSGELPGVKVRGAVRVDPADVAAYIEARKNDGMHQRAAGAVRRRVSGRVRATALPELSEEQAGQGRRRP